MKIDHLINFKCVADERSYTRAAERCFLTQPAIYSQVRQLEIECGAKLFHVSGKEVLLTAEGHQLYDFAESVAQSYEAYRKHSRGREYERAHHVRVGALSHLSTITEASRLLLEQDASLVVEFHSYHPTEAMELIRSGELDFGFYGPGLMTSDLTFERCGDCVVAVIAPAGHPLAGRDVTLEELAACPLIGYASGSARMAIDEWRTARNAPDFHYVAQADNSGATKTLALTVGVPAFVISEAITEDLNTGVLAEIHVRDFAPTFPLFVVYQHEDELGSGARRFLDLIRRSFSTGTGHEALAALSAHVAP